MSVANDGVSRFEASTVYAPVTFKGAVVVDELDVATLNIAELDLTTLNVTNINAANIGVSGNLTVDGDLTSATIEAGVGSIDDFVCDSIMCGSGAINSTQEVAISSPIGFYLSGNLQSQDIGIGAGAFEPTLNLIAFDQSYYCGGAVQFTLPDLLPVVGYPQGIRMRIMTTDVGTISFSTRLASGNLIRYFVSTGEGAASLNRFNDVGAGVATPPYQPNSVINVFSANQYWVIQGTTYTPA